MADEKWELQQHLGNPRLCRVKGPVFRPMPECEGGGWCTDEATARLIAAAPAMRARLESIRQLLNEVLYVQADFEVNEDEAAEELHQIDAILRKVIL